MFVNCKKVKRACCGTMLTLLLSALQAASLTCNRISLCSREFLKLALLLTRPNTLCWFSAYSKTANGLYTCAIKLSPLNNELRLPDYCHIQSPFWQDVMQVPGRQEPQLELKPIHQSCKRLSESTVQVPFTRAFILHPHIWPFCK